MVDQQSHRIDGEMTKIFGMDIANELKDQDMAEGDEGDESDSDVVTDLPKFTDAYSTVPKSYKSYGKNQTARSELNFYSIYNDKQKNQQKLADLHAKQQAEDEYGIDLKRPLQKPYSSGCIPRSKYYLQSFLVIYARMYALYLLGYQIGTRGLVIFDMYTDIIVAWALYKGNEKVWFMLSCLFIALPFVLVWSASLRFIQNYIEKIFYKIYDKWGMKMLINIALIIYMFPPAGSLVIAIYEVVWLISDLYYGIKAFLFGTGLVEANDRQTKAMKTYRKAIEIFAES